MARFSIWMLPEPGHLLPTMRIAKGLQRAGHRVCYLTTPQFREFIQTHGFDFGAILTPVAREVSCKDIFVDSEPGSALYSRARDIKPEVMVESLMASILQTEPDVLICDTYIWPGCGGYIKKSVRADIILCNVTLPGVNVHETNTDGLPELVLCPQELEIPNTVTPVQHRQYAEPSVFTDRITRPFEWNQIANSRPIVYCSFGSQVSRYTNADRVLQTIIDAFEVLDDYHLVLAAGQLYTSVSRRRGVSHITIVQSAPQLEILRRARVAITHGGLGTVKEAIMARVPMIVIPFDHDQPRNAKCVEYHGLGYVCSPEQCTGERIQHLVAKLVSENAAQSRLEAMSNIFLQAESKNIALSYVRRWCNINRACVG